jgi:hypothetical protein
MVTLRKMYGPAHGYWRIKVNKVKCNKFKYPDIVTVIKQHIMEYRGHVVRVGGEGTVW